MLLAAGIALEKVEAQTVVKLRRRDRLVETGPHDEVPDVRVRLEQHGRGKQDVVDSNHPVLVQLHVVGERRAPAKREVQRVMEVVVEIRTGGNDEVDEPALHHLDDAAAEPGRRQRAGYREPDRGVLLGIQHLLREDRARLGQARGVERLKSFVDEMANLLAPLRPVVPNRLAGEDFRAGRFGSTGRAVRHTWEIA